MKFHPLVKKVQTFSDEQQLITKGSCPQGSCLQESCLIVGLSGGPDSVALLSLLKELQPLYEYTLIAAHLDHQWRENSHEDIDFCRSFAKSLDVRFESATLDTITLSKKPGSQEEHGRLIRRAYFEELAHTYNAFGIALGHHYNDQQETFFLRMIRGASISGLAAMKPQNGLYIRPLLECTKDEILAYLKDKNISYLEDETNKDTKYLRNAIRHQVIPALRECDERFDRSFYKTLQSVQDTDAYITRITEEAFTDMTTKIQGTTALSHKKFLEADPFLKERLLIRWFCEEGVPFTPSGGFFNEVMRFMKNEGKEHQVHPSWKLVKKKGFLLIKHR